MTETDAAPRKRGRPPIVVTDAHRQAVTRALESGDVALIPCDDPDSAEARRCLGAIKRAAAELGADVESGPHSVGFWFRASKGSGE
jgi:hypothetical protein